jgi:hypothetical protein
MVNSLDPFKSLLSNLPSAKSAKGVDVSASWRREAMSYLRCFDCPTLWDLTISF